MAARSDSETVPVLALPLRDWARCLRARDGMRIVGALVGAGMLALTSGALAPGAADARSDRASPARSYDHERSSYGQGRSNEHDSSDERDRSNRRDESNDHDSYDDHDRSDDHDSDDDRDHDHDSSNGRDESDDRDESDERDESNERDGRDGRDRSDEREESDERDESGRRDRSSRRGQTDIEATQAPDVTPVQSAPAAPPSVPVISPTPAAAPQAQAPARAGEDARRPAKRGLGTGKRGGKAPRPLGSELGRQGNRDNGPSSDSAPRAPSAFATPAAAAGGSSPRSVEPRGKPSDDPASPVVRTVRDIVEIVPGWMKLAIVGLAALSLLLAAGYAVSAVRARSLARQRSELLGEVGLLQAALLPAVPADLGALKASVAYKPADGPAAGGDFYDVLPLPGGRCGFVLGDLSGHGRDALERTAFMRYTLRAYLEAGLEPRVALQVAGRVIGDGLGGDFATVLLAVHDPTNGSLTFAGAGHPAPIVVGGKPFEPVVAGSSPPLGIGEHTGLRQTTVPLIPRSVACLFTDGLIEARTADGLLGRERLEQIVAELGDEASASDLLERVGAEAVLTPDDMAACLLTPRAGVTSGSFRSEQLELSADELDGPLLTRFLNECGVPEAARREASDQARETAARFGGAVVSVVFGSRRRVQVVPRNVESLELASRRAADGSAMSARAS